LPDIYTDIIIKGGVVAFPTETVYGLGASAWNPEAIRKIFETKGRPTDNPLIVHVASPEMVSDFAAEIPDEATALMEAYWPGPLTLIFKKKKEVLDIITAGLNTVAVRMPKHPIALAFIRQTGPLVAPSANTSGKPSPTKPEHVTEDFGEDFPIIRGGACQVGIESTVLDVSEKPFEIYRPGFINRLDIEKIIHQEIHPYRPHKKTDKPKSPGMKYTHYSPDAEVHWLGDDEKPEENNTLYLYHHLPGDLNASKHIVDYHGDFEQMTRELYDRFRQADKDNIHSIAIQQFIEISDNELLIALNNRITKAIGKK